MKFLKFIAYLFYDYYSYGPRQHIKYVATLGAMTLITYINLLILLVAFNLDFILPKKTTNRLFDYLMVFIFMLPISLFYWGSIKENALEKVEYDTDKIIKGKFWLLVYIILSVIVLAIVITWKKGH